MKKLSIYLLLGGMVTATSCQKDLINPNPSATLSSDAAIATKSRIISQENGLYSTLKNGNFLGERYQIYNEVRGENFLNDQQNAFTAYQSWNFTVINNSQEVQTLWAQAYKAINNANVFVDVLHGSGGKLIDDSTNRNFIGEAKFVRALSYYSLLTLYARPYADAPDTHLGVILYDGGNTSVQPYQKARATVTQSYVQVIADLDSAELLLPANYNATVQNITHAHKNTAIALKTRVYLAEGDWAKVIAEANKIVSAAAPFTSSTGVPLKLADKAADVFKNQKTPENIFSLPFTAATTDNPGTQNSFGEYYLPGELGGKDEYRLNPAGIIANTGWLATDDRRAFIYKDSGGRPFLTKFATQSPFTDWAPIIRYAEVLLNLSEALARQTNTVDARAVALLNAVRNRSDVATTYTTASFATATDLINAILIERQIEFLGEGLRGPDITRLLLPFPAKGSVKAVDPSSTKYIWPLSSVELIQNTAAKDN